MRKILTGILVLTVLFCFAGCSNSDDKSNEENNLPYQSSEVVNTDSNIDMNDDVTQPIINNTTKCAECGRECETGHTYCSSHECWENGCLLPQKNMSTRCVNHSCLLCTSSRSYNSPYCSQHKCNRCENVVVDGSQYCVAHKCQLCNNQVFGNSPYCATHD